MHSNHTASSIDGSLVDERAPECARVLVCMRTPNFMVASVNSISCVILLSPAVDSHGQYKPHTHTILNRFQPINGNTTELWKVLLGT